MKTMKDLFSSLLFSSLWHSVIERFRSRRNLAPRQPLSPEQFRKMFAQMLTDPETRRLLAPSLIPLFPIQGGNPCTKDVIPKFQNENDCNTLTDSVMKEVSGKIGIGTTSPSSLLHVKNPSGSAVATVESDNGNAIVSLDRPNTTAATAQLELMTAGISKWLIGVLNDATEKFHIRDVVAGIQRLTIDTAGNVGLGTTSPGSRLVVGEGASNEAIKVNAGMGWADLILASGPGNGGSIKWDDGAVAGEIFYYHGGGGDYMSFSTNALERLRIDSSGNVGIGTTTPASLLHVKNPSGSAVATIESDNGNAIVSLDRPTTAHTAQLELMTAGISKWLIGVLNDATEKFHIRDVVAGMQRLTIDTVGNVGLGTPSPQSKLNVKGSASFAASGTVAVCCTPPSNPSNIVTGTLTSFTTQVAIGDRISVTISGKTYTRTVTEVTSNTSLKVDAPYHVTASGLTMTVLPSIFRGDNASGTPQFTMCGDGNARISGFLGLAGTRIHNDDDVGYVVCFAEVPFVDKNNEMRGYQSTMVYTRNTADADIGPGHEGWDVQGFVGAVQLKDMNLPSGDRDIRGQMKTFQSELRFEAKKAGGQDYNVVAPALNYQASLFTVDPSCSISKWAGYFVDSPCSVCGAPSKVTTGYGIWIENLADNDTLVGGIPQNTLVELNAAAIKIDGLDNYGRIKWTDASVYEVSDGARPRSSIGVLEFDAPNGVRTKSGVGFTVGGSGGNANCNAGGFSVAGVAGQTVTINYKKTDGTNGTLTFTGGILTGNT